jgi:hypothetical protein
MVSFTADAGIGDWRLGIGRIGDQGLARRDSRYPTNP